MNNFDINELKEGVRIVDEIAKQTANDKPKEETVFYAEDLAKKILE